MGNVYMCMYILYNIFVCLYLYGFIMHVACLIYVMPILLLSYPHHNSHYIAFNCLGDLFSAHWCSQIFFYTFWLIYLLFSVTFPTFYYVYIILIGRFPSFGRRCPFISPYYHCNICYLLFVRCYCCCMFLLLLLRLLYK